MTTEERVARAINCEATEQCLFVDEPYDRQGRLLLVADAAIEEHLAALADAGLVIVPREPTNAMVQGACKTHTVGEPMSKRPQGREECPRFEKRRKIWQAMITNAPEEAEAAMETDHD